MLGEVRLQAIERHCKTRDVEDIPDEDMLTVQGDNSNTTTQNRKEGIIAHVHLEVGDRFV